MPAPSPTLLLPSLWVLILALSSRTRTIAFSLTSLLALSIPGLQRRYRRVGAPSSGRPPVQPACRSSEQLLTERFGGFRRQTAPGIGTAPRPIPSPGARPTRGSCRLQRFSRFRVGDFPESHPALPDGDLPSLANCIQRAKLGGPSGDRGGVDLAEGRQPGWYPDPYHPPPSERYWDGGAWTEQTRGAGQRQPAGPARPAGWYPDPGGNAEVERYWDGAEWTDHYRPQKKGRGRWIALAAAAVVIVAAIVIAVVASSGGSTDHTPPTSSTITPATTARTPRTTTVTRPPRTTPTPTTATATLPASPSSATT